MTVKSEKGKDKNMLTNIITEFQKITKQPAEFLCELPQEKCNKIRELLQHSYKLAVKNDTTNANNVNILEELVIEGMDEEQIWQQLELRNEVVLEQATKEVPKLLNLPEEYLEVRLNEEDEEGEEEQDDEEEDEDENEEEEEPQSDEEVLFGKKKERQKQMTKKHKKTVVDDKFFKLNEMEQFLEAEDAKEMRKQKGQLRADDETGIDYFAEQQSDEEEDNEENVNYKDFFDSDGEEEEEDNEKKSVVKKDYFVSGNDAEEEEEENTQPEEVDKDEEENDEDDDGDDDGDDDEDSDDNEEDDKDKKQVKFDLNNLVPASDSDSDEEEKPQLENKSTFEMRQERLQARIKEYEEEVLGEKPWQLKGEVIATNRPQNALLEEILEFESTTRPAPVITEETTQRLEDIIRQRIKDQAWDDVELKVRPQQTPQEYRKQLVLDQEKSKQSLAQVYESEYQREVEKLDPEAAENAKKDNPAHKEIKSLMHDLFIKLDALTNFHFVPKPVAPESKIITNTPAINMEEVAPITMSDAHLLAPEEVYRGAKNGLLGKTERTSSDKNRQRRKKKQKQRAINKAEETRDLRRQKLGIPLNKKQESAKLLKKITKSRNVEQISTNDDKKSLKSSKAFFTQLQDQVATTKTKGTGRKRSQVSEEEKKNFTVKKFKL